MHKWVYVFLSHVFMALSALTSLAVLPALLASHKFQEAFFATIYTLGQRVWDRSFKAVRQTLLSRLDALVSHNSALRSRGAVRVLEVGAAYGANLEFVKRPVEYWKLEPNTKFDAAFQKNLAANPKVKLERAICGYGEDMNMLPDGHFDIVLLTYVLCSANDSQKLVKECKRVLVKGGLLLFSEHVAHPKGSVARRIEEFATPFVRILACGCHINRDSADVLNAAGFTDIEMHQAVLDIPFPYNRHIFGAATA
ncbi:thiol S-methyltransferase TMT1B-like [Amblyomma americanum]